MWLCTCTGAHHWGRVQTPEEGNDLFYHSPPGLLQRGLSVHLGIMISLLGWKPASPPASVHLGAGGYGCVWDSLRVMWVLASTPGSS